MAISGQQVASSSTLETLRTQFNNLVTDVAAIEGGSISYTTLNTTTTNATTLNVKEDGTIVFEGATDDGFETTLTVVDPTADRTITFPNETGTVHTTGGTTTHTAIVVADGGNIGSASDTDAIAIAANGNITVNQNLSVGGNLDVTGTLDLSDSDFTNVGSIQLDSIAGDGDTNTSITFSGSDVITIATGGSTAATFNANQILTLSDDLIIKDAGTIGSASDPDAIAIGADGDITLTQDLELQHDGAILSFGANDEIALTHVHDTGLLLTDSGGTPTLQLHDSNESIASDGSKVIITSGGTAFSLPTSDGSNGQVLQTNGSAVLSFGSVSSTGAFTAFEYTATAGQTSFSGNDDNSNSLAYTSGVNNVFVSVNGVMLDGSDYTATNGTAVVLSAAANANDMIKVLATNASSITTADLNGSEFVLDADGDTTLHADTDDQIDIKIAGADDFRFTANNFNVLSGSTLTIDSGATITNSGTASGFGLSTGKAIVLSMLFGGG